MTERSYVNVAQGLGDLADIAATFPGGTDWPPADCHVSRAAALEDGWPLPNSRKPEVVSDGPQLPSSGFWWTTLGELYAGFEGRLAAIGLRVLEYYLSLVPSFAGEVTAIPVVWRGEEGRNMRWLQSTLKGLLGGGVEQFQFKLDWGNPGADPDPTDAEMLTMATTIAGKWNLWLVSVETFFPPGLILTEVGVSKHEQTSPTNVDGSGGNLTSTPNNWFAFTVPQPNGASTSGSQPFEVSCCLTLQTDHRGPRGRGRLYLPPFAESGPMDVANEGLYNATFVDSVVSAFGDQIDAMKTALDPLVPVVVSRRGLILNEITSMNYGLVPDSQRRRRRSQDEARTTFWTA